MTRARRILMVLAASLLLLGIPGGLPASGEVETELFGYGMGATATALSTIYNQPSFGVPSDPTFELRKVHTVANLDSGPASRALGSILWLGDVVSNAPPSLAFDTLVFNPTRLQQLSELCFGPFPAPEDPPADRLRCSDPNFPDAFALGLNPLKAFASAATEGSPPYPVRSESFFPPGESDEFDVVPGAGMRSIAREDIAEAASTSGTAGVPGVITFGTLQSFSQSTITKDEAISEAWSRITGLNLLGALHIDSIITTARATSDGVKAKTEGTMEVTGLTIRNPGDPTAPATRIVVDETGFHAPNGQNQDPLGTLAEQLFDKYLAPQGISLSLGAPVELIEGAAGSRSITGLTVRLDSFGMRKLMDGLPPIVRQQILAPNASGSLLAPLFDADNPGGASFSPTLAGFIATFFQGDQTTQFVFGGAAVSAVASPEIPLPDIPPLPEIPPILPPGITPPVDFGTGGVTTPPQAGGSGGFLSARPVAVAGVPVGLLGLVILLALAGAGGLRRLADGMTSAPAAVRCPLEDAQ